MKIGQPTRGAGAFLLAVNILSSIARWSTLPFCAVLLAGCGGGSPAIPPTAAVRASTREARAIFDACLRAHGGAAAYARLHDVNIRFDSHWASVGPRLQPVLSDRAHRGGSEERYLPLKGGFIVGQLHHGDAGSKHVFRYPPRTTNVSYDPPLATDRSAPGGAGFKRSLDPEVVAAAGLVTDAYSMFLFGPGFFAQRGARFETVAATLDIDGRPCDELVTTLRPGIGSDEDKVVLFIDRQDHLLRRVQFTLNALESTKGAEVHVDLMAHRRLAGVMWPTRYSERIDRPVNLPAHQWSLLGFDANRGYTDADLAEPGFKGKAAAPARALP